MVDITQPISPSPAASNTDTSRLGQSRGVPGAGTPFVIQNSSVTFAPKYFPSNLRVRKARDLNRQSGYCGGEDVSDTGSQNREVHATGYVLGPEIRYLNEIVDSGEKFVLTCATWSGEVMIDEVELDGPLFLDAESRNHSWEYTIDLVSTGVDEESGSGAVDVGTTGVLPE